MRFLLVLLFSISQGLASDWVVHSNVMFHKSCFDGFGSEFHTKFLAGVNHGLSCLEKMSGMAQVHHAGITGLLNSQKLRVGCNNTEITNSSVARASISSKNDIPSLDLYHPYVSFKPDVWKEEWMTEIFLKFTSFHEVFHNLGYAHGRTEEYAYACEECCFGEEGENKENACKLCNSNYDGLKDPAYIKDFVSYYDSSSWSKTFMPQIAIRLGLMENPDSEIHREMLLDFDGYKSPLSIFSAKSWPEYLQNKVVSLISGFDYSIAVQSEIDFVENAYEARKVLLLEGDIERAIDLYLRLDQTALRRIIDQDKEDGRRLWNSILYDIDALFVEMEKISHPELKEVSRKYDEIIITRPAQK